VMLFDDEQIVFIKKLKVLIFKPLIRGYYVSLYFFGRVMSLSRTLALKVCHSMRRCVILPPTNSRDITIFLPHMNMETWATRIAA